MRNEQKPALLLRDIGMHPRYKGYAYLLHILDVTNEQPELLYKMSSVVYPEIMKKFETTRTGIDRNIRFAISRTWQTGNRSEIEKIFRIYDQNWLPTNIEFISIVTEAIRHGNYRGTFEEGVI